PPGPRCDQGVSQKAAQPDRRRRRSRHQGQGEAQALRDHMSTAPEPNRIIEPTSHGDGGQLYRVLLGADVLVARTRDPEDAAARALLARGFTGRAKTWRKGANTPRCASTSRRWRS